MRDAALASGRELPPHGPALIPYAGPFSGFHKVDVPVSKTSLVRHEKRRMDQVAGMVSRIRLIVARLVFKWRATAETGAPSAKSFLAA